MPFEHVDNGRGQGDKPPRSFRLRLGEHKLAANPGDRPSHSQDTGCDVDVSPVQA
jgi:hypothetical protein